MCKDFFFFECKDFWYYSVLAGSTIYYIGVLGPPCTVLNYMPSIATTLELVLLCNLSNNLGDVEILSA